MRRWVVACVLLGTALPLALTACEASAGVPAEDDAELDEGDGPDNGDSPADQAKDAVDAAGDDADGNGAATSDDNSDNDDESGDDGQSDATPAFEPDPMPDHGRFPTPRGLAADVHFWEKVFGQYSPDECIFHDKDNLSIIYAVKRLPGDTPAQQSRAVRRYLKALRASLKHLAETGEPRNALERRMYDITEPRLRYPAYWRYAMDNVRCQRGVDLGPSLARSRRHLKMVKRVLARQGLPTDLAYLPHLESGYDPLARSRAGARGLWQLMPITARLAGLRVTRHSDFRLDPLKATLAAAGMLKDFFSRTHSWPLAITAYNYGINGTVRAIKRWGASYMTVRAHHHTKLFGFAARNYYPSFLAVRNVAQTHEAERAEARR